MIKKSLQYWRQHLAIEAAPFSGVREAIQWLMLARLGILYLLLSAIVVQQILSRDALSASQLRLAYALSASAFAWNLLWSVFIHRMPIKWVFADIQIAFDIFIISLWMYFSGSSGILFALFYLIDILVVSVVLYQRGAWFAALLSCFMFGMVILFQKDIDWGGMSSWLGFSSIFLFVGLVGGYLSEELLRTTLSLKENQRMMERLSALHESILVNMPTGLLTVDRELRLNFINPAGEQILGKLSRDVVGKPLLEVEPGLLPFFNQIESTEIRVAANENEGEARIESAATGEHHRSFLFQKKSVSRLQQTVEVGTGSKIRLLRGDVAVLDAEAGFGRLLDQRAGGARILLFQDVTKLMHLEDRLKQNEKLAAVGQLAAGIAHEIRNPLAGMSASIEMLRQGLPQHIVDRENQKLMDIAIREIDRLNRLITEFLNYVKPEKTKQERIVLSELILDVLSTAKRAKDFEEKIQVRDELDKSTVALGSPEKLKQVIWNLVTNASQAMVKGGTMTVGCAVVDNDMTKFWVVDQGVGMSEEVLNHLYEPFFTTKERGTGLGLATVYKIVEAHHGEIKVESKVGGGTRFEVYLPKA